MRRRDFITLLGGAVGWPLGAHAQQPMPVVGFLHPGLQGTLAHEVAAFHRGLNETGLTEGQNVTIEYRWAEGQYARLPALAAELVRRQVAVIVAAGGVISALVVKAATTTIPTVMLAGSDPVKLGLVASMNRPGGNITGVSQNILSLEAKRVEMLCEVLPGATTIAVLVNPTNPNAEPIAKDLETVARVLGRQLHVLEASTNADFDAAFATIARHRAGGLVVSGDAFFVSQRDQLVALSARHALPAIYFVREFTDAGGLMSYGTDLAEAYPVIQQSTKVELVINLKTAKTLGLKIPLPLLGRADEVIE
jgi:putative ABC transport system substrate-binding protein